MTRNLIVCGGLLAGGITGGLAYFWWKRSYNLTSDEGLGEEVQDEKSSYRVLVLGLDKAGKSSTLQAVKRHGSAADVSDYEPTRGFNVVQLDLEGHKYDFWEIGGQNHYRQHWTSFTVDVDLLLYVIDASVGTRFHEAFDALHTVLADPLLAGVPVLICAHKQDTAGSHSVQDVKVAMGLDIDPPTKHEYHVIGTATPPNASPLHIREMLDLVVRLSR